MRLKISAIAIAALLLMFAAGCAQEQARPAAKDNVEKSLKAQGLDNINVDEDRDKGVITLKGEVKSPEAKQQAEEIAKASAQGEIVANELEVRPEGMEGQMGEMQENKDDAIESNFKAAIAQHNWDNQHIRFDAKEGVLTLNGDVDTAAQRTQIEKVAADIPGVKQVVNKLEVKGKK